MPACNLTESESANVKKNQCACGCGEPIATIYGERYASPACRQRAYRRRGAEGRVRTVGQRKADALVKRAAELRGKAREAERQAAYYLRSAASDNAEAGRLEAEASGQLKIPGIEIPGSKRSRGTDAGAVARPARDTRAAELAVNEAHAAPAAGSKLTPAQRQILFRAADAQKAGRSCEYLRDGRDRAVGRALVDLGMLHAAGGDDGGPMAIKLTNAGIGAIGQSEKLSASVQA